MIEGTGPKSEADWEAECDARTLSEAEVIKKDEGRLKKAQTAAERLAKEAADKAAAMKKVADPKAWFPKTDFEEKEKS